MLGWLCHFAQHRWRHVRFGIWQCTRCKELSLGRNPDYPTLEQVKTLIRDEVGSHTQGDTP